MIRVVLLLLAVAIPGVATAHPAPFSFLDLIIRDQAIDGILVLHVVDIAHDLGIEPAERLMETDTVARERDRMIALLTPRMTIRAGGRDVPIEWLEIRPAPDRQIGRAHV